MSARNTYVIRRATLDDIPTIAEHRVAMFTDMGRIHDAYTRQALADATVRYLTRAMPTNEYLAWVAVSASAPERIVAGAGVQRRASLPFPIRGEHATGIGEGAQAIVMNVYTHPAWRRLGIARALMHEILAWSRSIPLDALVLHASTEGRPLYESLGFENTNEMVIVP